MLKSNVKHFSKYGRNKVMLFFTWLQIACLELLLEVGNFKECARYIWLCKENCDIEEKKIKSWC